MSESESSKERQRKIAENLGGEIAAKEARKKKARQERDRGIWFGLGMFGLIGWSVAIPTLIGVALGIWIDASWPSRFSWTLMLLFLGVILGCLNAWYWVKRQSRYD
jgi:ATP synthase protein I